MWEMPTLLVQPINPERVLFRVRRIGLYSICSKVRFLLRKKKKRVEKQKTDLKVS